MLTYEQQEYINCARSPLHYLDNYGHVFNAEKQMITRMKCFEYQRKCIKAFHKHQNNIVLKSRQCLPIDTFVDTPSGPKAIQDFKPGDQVYSFNLSTNKIEVDTVYDAWESGERQCVKFKLKDSRSFEVGENHPFWVKNKQSWIKAKDLERGDEILDANLGFGNLSPSAEEVKILAYLITDGCTSKQVKFTNNNLNYLREFEESVVSHFPELEIRKSRKLKGFDYFPHQKHGVNTKNPIMLWCEGKGITNKKTKFKVLPKEVFQWNKESVSLLMNRMFAGDGWVSILKKPSNRRLELGITSPSKLFLEQVRTLLKKFSIKSNIYEVKNMKLQKNSFFKLRITHSKSICIFLKEIGIFNKVTSEHLEILENFKHDVKSSSTVQKVEKTTLKTCYDISVSKNENFLVNGLLTHNTGLSVVSAGYVAWSLLFSVDQKILIIANDRNGAVRFLKTVKEFIINTPEWLKPSEVKNNEQYIEFSNNSWAKAVAASEQAGRGESLTMLILDETAFIDNADSIWMGAGMAISQTKGKCIMISTPNGTGNLYHRTWVASIKNENTFNRLTVHWTENPICAKDFEPRVDENGKEFAWSPWYQEQIERLEFDSVKIAQELDLSFEGSKYLAVDSSIIDSYEKKIKDIKISCYYNHNLWGEDAQGRVYTIEDRFVKEKTSFWVWNLPEQGHKYIVSCDVARGNGKDYSTIQVLDAATLEQVAEYQGKVGPDVFAHVIYRIAMDYNEAYVVVEANSFGLATCLDLRNKLKYKKMYQSKSVKAMVEHFSRAKFDEGDDVPGFQTTQKTRPLLVSSLLKYMRSNELILKSPRLIQEFKTFVILNDKAQHEPGYNDDLIFALGIGLFIRDTEFENVILGQKFFNSMLDAIDFSSNTYRNPGVSNISSKQKDKEDGIAPIYGSKEDEIADDDLSWLIG